MRKTFRLKAAQSRSFSLFNIIIAAVSVLIAANLAFGPLWINVWDHSVKLFDNLLLFSVWLVLVLVRSLSMKGMQLSDVKFFINKFRYDLGLAVVLIFTGALRFMSISYGLPHLTEQHEQLIVPKVLEMIKKGTLNHGIYDYGSLYFVFLYFVFILISFLAGIFGGKIQSISDIDQVHFFLAARAANVILSLVCIYLVYLIGKRISGKRVGFAAASITAIGTVFFLNSITARLEILVLVFILLAFYYMVRLSETGNMLDYSLAGLFCGLAVGTKFYSITIIAALLYSHFLAGKFKTIPHKKLLTALLITLLAYLVTNPFIITNTESFLQDTSRLSRELSIKEHWSTGNKTPEAVYTRIIFTDGLGIIGSILFLALLMLFLIKPDARMGLLLVFPVIHFLVLVKSRFVFHRYILIILPFLVLFIISKLEEIIDNNKKKLKLRVNFIFWAVVILLALFPVIKMFQVSRQYSLVTTSASAMEWIKSHIPAGSRLLVSPYSVKLDERIYIITKMRKTPRSYSKNLISMPESGYNFIITSNTLKNYGLLNGAAECLDLVKKFEPVSGKIFGRTIFVLKVRSEPSSKLKKSESLFLKNGVKRNIVRIGVPDEDLIHLDKDWKEAVTDNDISYRQARSYPAAFFFTLSPLAKSRKNISLFVDITPPDRGGVQEQESFIIKLNGRLMNTFPLRFNGKRNSLRCVIPIKLLTYGKNINKLEFDLPGTLTVDKNLEKRVLSVPLIKYHSVSISAD